MNDETSKPWKEAAEDFLQKLLATRKELDDIKSAIRSSKIAMDAIEAEGFNLDEANLEEQQVPASLDALSVSDEMRAIRHTALDEAKALPTLPFTKHPSGDSENALQDSDLQNETKIAVSKMVEQCKANIDSNTSMTEFHHPPLSLIHI